VTRAALAAAAALLVLSSVGPCFSSGLPPRRGDAWADKAASALREVRSPVELGAPSETEALWGHWFLAGAAAFAVAVGILTGAAPARADASIVGEIQASGLIFKDSINIQAITDPKVSGVTLYQSDFSRSGFDKLKSGDLFSDPGSSGLSCIGSPGKVLVSKDISRDRGGEAVFEESKAFFGKTLKVKRVYDEKNKNVVYVVYTERFNKDDGKNGSRFKSQVCAIHVDGEKP